MKYSPIAQPAYGAMKLSEAASEADAATMIVKSIAPFSSRVAATRAIEAAFCPMAT